jgi:hypothetical protein
MDVSATALEVVAADVDQAADDEREIARQARSMQHLRDLGWSWTHILNGESAPGILTRLRDSAHKLLHATSQLTAALAHGLHEEGQSLRQIGHLLGVTHQRVSAILRHREVG